MEESRAELTSQNTQELFDMAIRQMIPMRRTDGFSADGLSYSVANDLSKQIGQAEADIEARTKNPRFTPGARVENPDAPELLRKELLDPILASFGASQPTATPKDYHVDNSLVRLDPVTGKASVLYTAPQAKKEQRYKVPTSYDLLGKPQGEVALTLDELAKVAPTLPDQVRTNAPIPGLLNLINHNQPQMIAPGQRGHRGALDRAGAKTYLDKAGGDRAKAEQMAKDDGYDF